MHHIKPSTYSQPTVATPRVGMRNWVRELAPEGPKGREAIAILTVYPELLQHFDKFKTRLE
jgi:hypothetical protein